MVGKVEVPGRFVLHRAAFHRVAIPSWQSLHLPEVTGSFDFKISIIYRSKGLGWSGPDGIMQE